jgi:hypothetical protein
MFQGNCIPRQAWAGWLVGWLLIFLLGTFMPTPYDCFSVQKILHTPKLEKKRAKDVSLKPIEILSIIEGEDTPRQTTCNF